MGKWWRGKIKGKSQPAGSFYEEFVLSYDPAAECLPIQSCREYIGYSVTFKETSYYVTEKPGSDLECIICQGLACDACQTGCCGHTVCSNCGRKWKGNNNSCPHCRKPPLSLVDDPRTKRYIAGLTLYCSYYDVGCDWRGSLNEINGHLRDDCQFTLVACKHYSCREKIQRRNLKEHAMNNCPMRPVSCPFCNESSIKPGSARHSERKGSGLDVIVKSIRDHFYSQHEPPMTHHDLISTHYKECPSWPMRCPNHCGTKKKLTRSTLQNHIDNNCPEQVVSCQFAEAGCTVRVKRKEMADHIQKSVGEHMIAMMRDHVKLKKEHSTLKREHNNLQIDYNALKKPTSCQRKSLQCWGDPEAND